MNIFYTKLQNILTEFIISEELPENSIYLYSNISKKGKNAGKEISKSLCIYEPEYPLKKTNMSKLGKNFVIMNIKQTKTFIELIIRNKQFDSLVLPSTASEKLNKSDTQFHHIIFSPDDDSLYEYVRDNIKYCLSTYESSSNFACCSRFIECSDAKKCVHENKLYSKGCMYRINLDLGHIFYGKNKNI